MKKLQLHGILAAQIPSGLLLLSLFLLVQSQLSAQWFDAGSYVRLSSISDEVHIGSTAAPASKLRVYSPSSESFNEFVDFTTDHNLSLNNDALNITVGATSNTGAQFIECNRGNTSVFTVDVDGAIDLARDGSTSEVIRVRNDEALWYNGTYFSWGFDADYNYFGRPLTIGTAVQPVAGDGIRTNNLNVTIDKFSSTSTRYFAFRENGTLKAYLGYSGRHLFVENNESFGGVYLDAHDIGFNIDDVRQVTIDNNGRMGVGTPNPGEKLDVRGNVSITGELTSTSDRRVKKNIRPITNALTTIQGLHPVHYDFRTEMYPEMELPTKHKMGLVAQEVEEILPDIVTESTITTAADGTELALKSVNYLELVPLLIQSIKELKQELSDTQTALTNKESQVANLESRLAKIEKVIELSEHSDVSKK